MMIFRIFMNTKYANNIYEQKNDLHINKWKLINAIT